MSILAILWCNLISSLRKSRIDFTYISLMWDSNFYLNNILYEIIILLYYNNILILMYHGNCKCKAVLEQNF